ncbi:hypothetical protein LIER_20851 [Lithospermum erythrorhizon]|uniref:Uncharacterized protein n=1 Tax=Lithospermum erythrorhizon TaxID=34254 RepID=A0AAV3QN23_LITER
MVLKEEEGVMSTFQALTRPGLGDFPDLRSKLEGFFRKAKKEGTTLSVASQGNTSEASCKLVLLMVFSKDLSLKQQCEVQKAEELEKVAAELDWRHVLDICGFELMSKGPPLLSLILRQLTLPGRFIPWRERSELLTADLETARLGLVGLL